MTWFKVDDSLALHPKALRAGNAAMGLWVRAGAWSAQQLTDGHIPAEVVVLLGDAKQAAALVRAGLWIADSDGGFTFHGWTDRQPTREAVETRRAEDSARKARARAAWKAQNVRADNSRTPGGFREESVLPDPTRPDPTRPERNKGATHPSAASASASEDGFDDFWDTYPRKVDKGGARAAYKAALKKTTADAINSGAQAYAEHIAKTATEPRFTAHPKTWLNGERWNDAAPATAMGPRGTVPTYAQYGHPDYDPNLAAGFLRS